MCVLLCLCVLGGLLLKIIMAEKPKETPEQKMARLQRIMEQDEIRAAKARAERQAELAAIRSASSNAVKKKL